MRSIFDFFERLQGATNGADKRLSKTRHGLSISGRIANVKPLSLNHCALTYHLGAALQDSGELDFTLLAIVLF